MAPLLALMVLATSTGTLAVDSPDYGATVVVDRRPLGIIPIAPAPVAAGLHLVEILRDGRPAWTRLIFVPPGVTVRLVVNLPMRTLPPITARRPDEPPAPRYRLAGSVGAEVAAAPGWTDLDLVQRWRLEASDAPVPGLSAAVEAWVFSDLLDRGDERSWVPRHSERVHVEEARVGYEGRSGEVQAGRLREVGPGGRVFLLDGARAQLASDAIALHARGGWRHEPRGPMPSSPELLGAGLSLIPWRDAIRMSLDAIWQESLHLDGHLHAQHGWARLALAGRSIGHELAAADARVTVEHAGLAGWVEGGVRSDARGAFETPRWWLTLTELISPAGWSAGGGARWHRGAWQASAQIERRDGAGAASAVHPDRWQADAEVTHGIGRGRLGVIARWLDADIGAMHGITSEGNGIEPDSPPLPPDPPALRRWLMASLIAETRFGPWHLATRAGVESVHIDAHPRLLPTGEAIAGLTLGASFELGAALRIGAVHPALHPQGGPLISGLFHIRLR